MSMPKLRTVVDPATKLITDTIVQNSLPTQWGQPLRFHYPDNRNLQHCRFGHPSDNTMDQLRRASKDAHPSSRAPFAQARAACQCTTCPRANIRRHHAASPLAASDDEHTSRKATRFLERVSMDETGRFQIATYDNCRYFTVFVDEFTKFKWVYMHQSTAAAPAILRRFLADIASPDPTAPKLGTLRMDQLGTHVTPEYLNILQWHHVRLETSCVNRHHQNGHAERAIAALCHTARALLVHAALPREYWAYAVRYATYLHNILPKASLEFISPHEKRYGTPPDLTKCRVFGCYAVPRSCEHFAPDSTLSSRGPWGIFLGVAVEGADFVNAADDKRYNPAKVKGYVIWTLDGGPRTIIDDDVYFNEEIFPRCLTAKEWEHCAIHGIPRRQNADPADYFTEADERTPFDRSDDEKTLRAGSWKPQDLVGATVKFDSEKLGYDVTSYDPASQLWRLRPHDASLGEELLSKSRLKSATVITRNGQDAAVSDALVYRFDTEHCSRVLSTWAEEDEEDWDANGSESGSDMDEDADSDAQAEADAAVYSMDSNKGAPTAKAKPQKGLPPIETPDQMPDPQSYRKAMESPEKERWLKAIKDEVQGLVNMGTWESVDPIPGRKPIHMKWAFKIKWLPGNVIDKFKARLCVRGDMQTEGVDYFDTFAAVSNQTTARMLLSLVASLDLECHVVDVSQAYLYAPIDAEVYLKPAPGVNDALGEREHRWLRLKKSLYGLCQGARNWSNHFHAWFLKQGFRTVSDDACLYIRERVVGGETKVCIVLTYVDDAMVVGTDLEEVVNFKNELKKDFQISDKEDISYYLGVQVTRDRVNKTLTITQEQFIEDLAVRANITSKQRKIVPLPHATRLTKNLGKPYEHSRYRSLIGSVMYLGFTRPDVACAASELASQMQNPSAEHHKYLDYLIGYLLATKDHGITYRADVDEPNRLVVYADAEHAGNPETRRSRGGWLALMNGGAISFKSKFQSVIALSTTDAEVYSACKATQEAMYLRLQLSRLGLAQGGPTVLYEDNQATIHIAINASWRDETKHIGYRKAFLREASERRVIDMTYVRSSLQLADILTKTLPVEAHRKLWALMGGGPAAGNETNETEGTGEAPSVDASAERGC